MSRGPEGKIQDAVIKYARKKGLLCKKNEVGRYFVQSGWPDFMIFGTAKKKPHMVFMEFKRLDGVLTPLQKKVYKEITKLGFNYFVVDNVPQGARIIDQEFA